jgi:hypothetical protein
VTTTPGNIEKQQNLLLSKNIGFLFERNVLNQANLDVIEGQRKSKYFMMWYGVLSTKITPKHERCIIEFRHPRS